MGQREARLAQLRQELVHIQKGRGASARNLVHSLPAVQTQLDPSQSGLAQSGLAQSGLAQLGLALPLELRNVELDAVNQALPDRGFLQGGVVELSVSGGAALATSLSLAACRSAQRRAQEQSGEPAWCAFIDPSCSLYGPGVLESGVLLERLLVLRPPVEALGRVALRVAESRAFSVLVIDTLGVPGSFGESGAFGESGERGVSLKNWSRIVRRLALSAENSSSLILLLTDKKAARSLPLPVAQRIELERPSSDKLTLWVKKDRFGRVFGKRTVSWPCSDEPRWEPKPACSKDQHRQDQHRQDEHRQEEGEYVRRFA
jgi:recombination protein RecA